MTEVKGVILLTGYEPFFDMKRNSSLEACKPLQGRTFNGYTVAVEEIPMDYTRVRENIERHLRHHNPSAAICTGVTSRGAALALERVAINLGSAEGRSNFGYTRLDQPLNPEGPAAYFTTLPFRALLRELKDAEVPAVLSNSAGTYGCNQIFYHLMDYLERTQTDIPAGFVHVPRLPEQVLGENAASMSLETASRGMEAIVRFIAESLP